MYYDNQQNGIDLLQDVGATGPTGPTPPCIYAKPNKPLCLQANAKLHRKKGTL